MVWLRGESSLSLALSFRYVNLMEVLPLLTTLLGSILRPGAPHVSITTWDQQLPWEDLALEFPLIVNVSAYLSLLGIYSSSDINPIGTLLDVP